MATNDEKKVQTLEDWVNSLYDEGFMPDEELLRYYEEYRYHGFNRGEVLAELRQKVPDTKISSQIVLVCALNGPQRAAETKLISGRLVKDYGIPASGMQRKRGISCQRITAATADLAAMLLKRLNAPKRLNLSCPGWLQFPSAGSIKLPHIYRIQHIEFSQRFSSVIGGNFNESIYQQMINNAYLDDRFRQALFGQEEIEDTRLNPIIPPKAAPGTIDMNPPSGMAIPNPQLSMLSSTSSMPQPTPIVTPSKPAARTKPP